MANASPLGGRGVGCVADARTTLDQGPSAAARAAPLHLRGARGRRGTAAVDVSVLATRNLVELMSSPTRQRHGGSARRTEVHGGGLARRACQPPSGVL